MVSSHVDNAPVHVRSYAPGDRAAVRTIFLDTAFHGRSYRAFFGHGEWLADWMTMYYTDIEPESCFVAELNGRVIGYLTGTRNTAAFRRIWAIRILPRLVVRFITHSVWKSRQTWAFLWQGVKSGVRNETPYPKSIIAKFPAHLHINVDAAYRGTGIGHRLIETYVGYLRARGVTGVHARTARVESRNPFFEALGFHPELVSRMNLWTYLGQPVYHLITYARSLTDKTSTA